MKTTSNIKIVAALLMAGVCFAACTNDEIVNEPRQTSVTDKTYTLIVNATKDGNEATTRALSLDGKTLNAAWAESEEVTVYNVTKNADLTGTLIAQSSGASTILKGSLTGVIEDGDVLKLKFLSPDYTSQTGTLEYIAANCDYAEAEVNVTDASTPTVTTTAASFTNQQAIVKFTLKDKANDEALSVLVLDVNDGTNTYTVTPASATDVIYVAIPGFSMQTITLTANVNSNYYVFSKSDITFTNSQYYAISVKMTKSYVDLGLPSGTLWATCNVGANSPEEYGTYFAWGETEPKEEYNWNNYKHCKGKANTLTKYCGDHNWGTVDGKGELEPEDDAATINWGINWQMPNYTQIDELKNSSYTTTEWITMNGTNGRLITSKSNGNSIFLPATGNGNRVNVGSWGTYWSRSVYPTTYEAWYLNFSSEKISRDLYSRSGGYTIRPVRKQ